MKETDHRNRDSRKGPDVSQVDPKRKKLPSVIDINIEQNDTKNDTKSGC